MDLKLILKNIIFLICNLFCTFAFSGEIINNYAAIRDAQQQYLIDSKISDFISNSSRDIIISILLDGNYQKNGRNYFRIALVAGQNGRNTPTSSWVTENVRIYDLVYKVNGILETISDVTKKDLPISPIKACFWVTYRDERTKAGRTCINVNQEIDHLKIRFYYLGFGRKFIPWHKSSGDILTESCPEVYDGAFDDQTNEWCPWSATFEGVYNEEETSKVNLLYISF